MFRIVLVLSLTIIVNVNSSDQTPIVASCSRSDSRTAREILREIVYPLLDFAVLEYPPNCPWNPVHDVFRVQEAMKLKNSFRDWECQACGKRFVSEFTIDLHMTNRHNNLVNHNPNATCLATYCPILRCEVLSPDLAFGDQVFWESALCEERQFDSLRQQCQSIINMCAPESDPNYQRLKEWLQIAVCDHLTCERYWIVPDHRLATPFWQYVGYALIIIFGLIIYYAAIFYRLSANPGELRASELSSPYFLARYKESRRYSSRIN